MKLRIVGLLAGLALAAGATNAAAGPTVDIGDVVIDGTVSPSNANVDEYFGIPYASQKRWMPPAKAAALTSPFDAEDYATVDACPQSSPVVVGSHTLPQSEDCLSLNVFVPASATPTSKLPVYVFIHGGELQLGSGVEYFPVNFVGTNDIIAVTINYRLGALGFLAQSAIAASKTNSFQNLGDAGDYGLMDQQFALQWVKKNIAAFGGDSAKVTVGGQSAGGSSVLLNLVSPGASGLFRGAIVESGAFQLHNLTTQAAYETAYGNPFVNAVLAATGTVDGINCASLTTSSPAAKIAKCLNGATVATLLTAQTNVFGAYGIAPDTGTQIVPNGLQQALTAGDFPHIPVLIGSDLNEGRYFEPGEIPFAAGFSTIVAAGGPANYDLANANSFCSGGVCTYQQEVNLFLNNQGVPASDNTTAFDKTLANTDYKLADYPDQYLAGSAPTADAGLAQIGTDHKFACNALDATTDLAGFSTVYAYEFQDPLAPPSLASPPVTATPNDQYGYATASEHGSELQFLFLFPFTDSLSADEQQLEATMRSYWGNFVKNGNPAKGATVPKWPAYGTKGEVLKLVPGPASPSAFTTFGKEHFCTIWEPIISAE
ncbi:MAG: carboxylesterase family protein [Rhizomicrobium sp.]|jgi:para-nitrobenzyl esterase